MKNMDVKYENHKDQETVKLDGKNIPLDCLENQKPQGTCTTYILKYGCPSLRVGPWHDRKWNVSIFLSVRN